MYQIQSTARLGGYLETRIGGREENQDSCGFSDSPLGAIIVVCDGMGGLNGGRAASSLAVQSLIDTIGSANVDDDPVETIRKAIIIANSTIIQTGNDNPELSGMGTTMTLLLLNDDCAYVANIGDSRCYQLRSGRKVFRTFDDSVVFQLVKSGAISEEEARVAGNSNIITKALGIQAEVECEVACLPYDKKDRFVLCSDGFWGALPEKRLLELLGMKDDLSIVFERTLNKVEIAAKERYPNHYDNLTAAVVDVKHFSKIRSRMERLFKLSTICLSILLLISIGLLLLSHQNGNRIDEVARCHSAVIEARNNVENLVKEAEKNGKDGDSFGKKVEKAKKKVIIAERKEYRALEVASKDIEKAVELSPLLDKVSQTDTLIIN